MSVNEFMPAKLYTLDSCSKCLVVKDKLEDKNIKFTECRDKQEMEDKNILGVPTMEFNGTLMNFTDIIAYLNSI